MAQAVLNAKPKPAKAAPSGPWREGLRAFRRNKLAMLGLLIILFFVAVAFLAPSITHYDYKEQVLLDRLQAPSAAHWFGTDDLGRDLFTRIVYGTRISLWVGIVSVLGSMVAGTLLGILAGFYGRWADIVISRFFDILLSFPNILLAIAVVAVLGPSLQNALLAIAIVNVPVFGRLVRAKVLSLRTEEYVTAAKALGMKNARILFVHILPNSLGPIIVQATLSIAHAIIECAALGFLGMGAQPPEPEWGKILSDSRQFIQNAPWTVLFPGLSIMLTVLGFNLIGDGLRDVLDPRMKQ
ncbi:peptide ABC transporter permease [Gordoniibacillus kamchatkensis]|uniref:Peptide ABC transporter permease n=1 Tax=Gordoniibacillus kamchatkensis TaxID=1590651 RepID=A0ABR5ABT3_9BACL|nr:ABC transporter permease [Paenibacillus sp. VKM B-2647]KIL38520.1 peptide ABC transporter permease [Paenibacillus sp. VKM B-2647]